MDRSWAEFGSKMLLAGLVNRQESNLGEVGEPTATKKQKPKRKKTEKTKGVFEHRAFLVEKVSLAAAKQLFAENQERENEAATAKETKRLLDHFAFYVGKVRLAAAKLLF